MNKTNLPTIKSLRLNLDEARAGRTWLLLPEGYRDHVAGRKYPILHYQSELQQVVLIPLPAGKRDSGCVYIKRCIVAWRAREAKRVSTANEIGARRHAAVRAQYRFAQDIKGLKAEARKAVEDVQKEAASAAASLKDLFELARQGLEGQMKAHLDGSEWQGEKVNARAFRECFRLVAGCVKGLGMPSDQREKAIEVVMEEAAKAIRDTQETVGLAPGSDDPETVN